MLDPILIIKTVGLLGIFFIIFAESGLFFGFFFPGDTLLFASGILASQGLYSLNLLIIGCIIASIVGDNVGYWTGKRVGRKLFERETSFLFNKKNILKAENFYERHGPITIIVARFIPLIRTFAPIVAGIAKMRYRKFLLYNMVGGILWTIILPLLGYYFGSIIPNPDKFILPLAVIIIGFSFMPFVMRFVYYLLKKKS